MLIWVFARSIPKETEEQSHRLFYVPEGLVMISVSMLFHDFQLQITETNLAEKGLFLFVSLLEGFQVNSG